MSVTTTIQDELGLICLDRTKRVKDAKSEAQKEIEEYKKQKQEEFKKFEAEVRTAERVIGHGPANNLTAQARKQESRRRCQQRCRDQSKGDRGGWEEVGEQGCRRPPENGHGCEA